MYSSKVMNRRKIKNFVIDALECQALEDICRAFGTCDPTALLNPLFSSLCHTSEKVRWHGISVLGRVVAQIGDDNIEDARVIMRRFLWMLNDESGGIGWGVPEAMAEAMVHSDDLAAEYMHMLISYTLDDGPELYQNGNFLELPLLQRGVLWGLCRVAAKYRQFLLNGAIAETLVPYFDSADDQVAGLVCCLADSLGLHTYLQEMNRFRERTETVRIYLEGTFYEPSLSDIVNGAFSNSGNSCNPFLVVQAGGLRERLEA